MSQFYVIGGEYQDTSFTVLATGHAEERHGPFSEEEALRCWRGLTGKTIDNALIKYKILQALTHHYIY